MASADVMKPAVFDDRIVQTVPQFAVQKGALSNSNTPFAALSQSSSQHTYNIQVPSENIFIDRRVNWSSQMFLQQTWTLPNNATLPPPAITDIAIIYENTTMTTTANTQSINASGVNVGTAGANVTFYNVGNTWIGDLTSFEVGGYAQWNSSVADVLPAGGTASINWSWWTGVTNPVQLVTGTYYRIVSVSTTGASSSNITLYIPSLQIGTTSQGVVTVTATFGSSGTSAILYTDLREMPLTTVTIPPFGKSWSYKAFPLQSCTTTMQANINDQVVVVNSQDVLNEVLRLTDFDSNRLQRTTPTRMDVTAHCFDDGALPFSAYGSASSSIMSQSISSTLSTTAAFTTVTQNTWVAASAPVYKGGMTSYTDQPNGAFISGDPTRQATNTYYPYLTSSFGTLPSSDLAVSGGILINGASISSASYVNSQSGGTYGLSAFVNPDGSVTLIFGNNSNVPAIYSISLFVAPFFTEKLVLPPFIFSDEFEASTGLTGIQNMTILMNMRPPGAGSFNSGGRICRQLTDTFYSDQVDFSMSTATTPLVSSVGMPSYATPDNRVWSLDCQYGSTSNSLQAFANSRLDFNFLTPSLDLPLAPKSIVPYMEFPRYITTTNSGNQILAGAVGTILSNSITLPMIPDLLCIYVKPSNYSALNVPGGATTQYGCQTGNAQGEWYYPITNINLQWDNFSGVMSAFTQAQLYELSVSNGLNMDYMTWSGRVNGGQWGGSYSSAATYTATNATVGTAGAAGSYSPVRTTSVIQTTAGPLLVKPGKDFALQTGQAPGLVGNFTFSLTLTCLNTSPYLAQPVMYILCINSGFFESQKGTSRIVKGILNEADIITAAVAPTPGQRGMQRAVGGSWSGYMSKLGNFATQMAPVVSSALPMIQKYGPQAVDMLGSMGKRMRQ